MHSLQLDAVNIHCNVGFKPGIGPIRLRAYQKRSALRLHTTIREAMAYFISLPAVKIMWSFDNYYIFYYIYSGADCSTTPKYSK
jgi:hypothetical protein